MPEAELTLREFRVLMSAVQWAACYDEWLWHPDKQEIPKRKRAWRSLLKKFGAAIATMPDAPGDADSHEVPGGK